MLDFDWHRETPRLYLSHVDPSNDAHCDFFIECTNNAAAQAKLEELAQVMPRRRAVAQLQIEPRMARMEATGYGRYLVSLKKPDAATAQVAGGPFSQQRHEPIGCVSMQLARFPGPGPTVPDVGFSFLDRHRGKGYAAEAARALMEYFEEERGQSRFLGITGPDNEGAKKLLRRLGFEDRGLATVGGVTEDGSFAASVWSRNLPGELRDYGIGAEA
ncbi:hypothetical protein C8035_v010004 [Colletotrichum spinosum]|uniref:N-acetyltransferase domain-containing protein n=1 Tax=Colletotrichum spinosum TaxID=1347390 RepID=A0A4R8Q9G3_9PEZI|nr:hypothetical protein C8035_v010004 [Colletotrichum spinosum]